MIVVMAASGSAAVVRSPKQVWCFSAADARRASAALVAEFEAEEAVDVFSVDFPEVTEVALRSAAWHKTAEDCTRIALAMYLKYQQGDPEPFERQEAIPAPVPLRRAA